MTRRVVVIGGGESAEHDVSLATATAVAEALRSSGFDVDELTIDPDGMWRRGADALGSQATGSLAAARVVDRADVVFPAVHGPSGEDGTLAAPCALAHKPAVGSGLRDGALGMDKWATKLVAEAVGVRTAPAGWRRPQRSRTSGSRRRWWWSRPRPGRASVSPWHATPPSCATRCGVRRDSTTGS